MESLLCQKLAPGATWAWRRCSFSMEQNPRGAAPPTLPSTGLRPKVRGRIPLMRTHNLCWNSCTHMQTVCIYLLGLKNVSRLKKNNKKTTNHLILILIALGAAVAQVTQSAWSLWSSMVQMWIRLWTSRAPLCTLPAPISSWAPSRSCWNSVRTSQSCSVNVSVQIHQLSAVSVSVF